MSLIINEVFNDLIVGESFSDVSKLHGARGVHPAPDTWTDEVRDLRSRCSALRKETDEREFSIVYQGVTFRVTTLVDVQGETIFTLRKTEKVIRPFSTLGYPKPLYDALMDPGLTGTVLFGGPMAAGKTSSAASYVVERMKELGEYVYAVENPRETNLNGRHGKGRCTQVPVSRNGLDLQEQLATGVRTGADTIFVGELRRGAEAYQAAQSGINGHLIVSTSHGASLPDLIERVAALASEKHNSANSLLAAGLAIVVFQKREVVQLDGDTNTFIRSQYLIINGNDSARAKIRAGHFSELELDIELQSNKLKWSLETQRA